MRYAGIDEVNSRYDLEFLWRSAVRAASPFAEQRG